MIKVTDCVCVCVCHSMVRGGLWRGLLLHPDPAGAAGGLCPLLERVLGGEDGDGEPEGLVRRSVTRSAWRPFTFQGLGC